MNGTEAGALNHTKFIDPQKKCRRQLQRKLQNRAGGKPNQQTSQEVIDQAARDLEFVNGPQGKSLLIQRGQLGLN